MSNYEIHCEGCGVPIQTEEKGSLGYAPPSALEREQVICQRCFRLKHYNEVQDVSLTDDDYRKILSGIGSQDALIVKIVDIFDFSGSWLPGIHRFVGKNPILLVGNKLDLLPKSVKPNKIKHWMKYEASQQGVKPIDVELMSAEKRSNITEVAEAIEKYRGNRDVYIVGATNVGKSTFINQLIKEFGGETASLITTSHYPGTTLDLIEIPLDEQQSLFDTPGIINHHQLAHYINKKDLKKVTPKKEVKPKVYQLNEGQTLFFGGLARFDFVHGDRQSFTCYLSNELPIHRTKLEKASDLYENQKGELLSPPDRNDIEQLPPLVKHEFSIKEDKTDIVYSGLGWVTVAEAGTNVSAYAPKGVGVYIRNGLI
ncbi:ribosome biogenesis GTPase YqeH [Pseudalkalibacillus berkeleyi]|uniref:Ribosome biogenesis GTPase YqeH n=1 Tax=Pseudalkalibacillus berkeleyi TaxID=1069813 RepID=A0ABS9H220_9BACL|nr:ribosome biogenesis GTPase YqeH [Pseudalkalibacillus berkeleyi]MCF6138000.1 ribosome biogenesis GTPase YqeH [Pseudalkalibacillus berkeleyi]